MIITGASKGLGLSLLNLALNNDYTVITLSRTKSTSHSRHLHISHDLSKSKGIEVKLNKALLKIDLKKIKSVTLINNAAMIGPIGEMDCFKVEEMEAHLKLNLLTPMVLSGWLMKTFKNRKFPITMATISSGAASRPIINWSLYCSTKSAINMLTECLILDYKERPNFRAFSFSPGVMDTEMQSTIRQQKKSNFKDIERFRDLKQKNQLLSPDKVAQGLFSLINNPQHINEAHYDIRQF